MKDGERAGQQKRYVQHYIEEGKNDLKYEPRIVAIFRKCELK